MNSPYHRSELWRARGISPPLIIIIHSYYSLSFGWHVTYQFSPKGAFYSLPENEFNLLFSPCRETTPQENSSSKTVSLWRRLFYIKPPAFLTAGKNAISRYFFSK